MGKIILLLLFIIILLTSCDIQKSNIEIIEDYDKIYLQADDSQIKVVPTKKSMNLKFKDEFSKVLKELNSDAIPMYFPIGYRFYVGKSGKIERIKEQFSYSEGYVTALVSLNSKLTKKNIFSDSRKLTQQLIPLFEKIEFEPASLNGESVPFRTDLSAYGFMDEIGNIKYEITKLSEINLELHMQEDGLSEYFVKVDEMPSPIGGIAAIQQKIRYPEIAKRAGIEGRVYVKAYIDENGNVMQTEILKGLDAGCSEAASEAVKNTKFEPGRQKGKPVKVQVTVPILFRLSNNETEK